MSKGTLFIIIAELVLGTLLIVGIKLYQNGKIKVVEKEIIKFRCIIEGNEWISNYPERAPFCLEEHSDAGKECTSSSECKGGCVVEKVGELGKTGHCKKNSLPPSGCFAYVEDNFLDYYAGDTRFRCSGEDMDKYSQQACKECL
jgi:hypothetical protein